MLTRSAATGQRLLNVDMIQHLLDAGADPDLAVGDGLTPRFRFEKSHFLQHFRLPLHATTFTLLALQLGRIF